MNENKLVAKDDISNNDIKNLIYTIRGKQVMLDYDVAMLYHYQTKRINETVSRNKERFPENFCFQLTENEVKNLKLKAKISNLNHQNNLSQIEINFNTEETLLRSQFATLKENKERSGRGKRII